MFPCVVIEKCHDTGPVCLTGGALCVRQHAILCFDAFLACMPRAGFGDI